ncbi:MAG: hypothetical protein A3F89_01275 [Deltaproteobacteria bacterium RIFCSPLOWO2_12_FULL_50_11]|nr:MAG: hypothetical protein A3F89_01275 [Deltaproteobacteria bacterium RIFCSPLOWO2_12_FULL_50_11]
MGQKILMIDDEPDFTELISTLLQFHQFSVDAYNDPKEIVGKIDQKNYDLVICDLMMDGIDGFEICRRFRKMERYKDTPFIVLSGKTLTDEERKSLLELKVHFVPKPFEPNKLVEKVRKLLVES